MDFDLGSFGIGLVTGWITAYAVYRARGLFQATAATLSDTTAKVSNAAVRSADSRYVSDLIAFCESAHLAGGQVKLSDIVIEPRFVPQQEFARPIPPDEYRDVFEIVPRTHDHPSLYSHYNIDTLSINELSEGSRAVALLGEPGSGRTTALLAIALHSLGKIRFTPPPDTIQQQLDSEEERMNEKERSVRIKERVMMEQRAKEQLAMERGVKFDEKADEETKNKLPLFNRLMPIYVHFGDIRLGNEYGGQIDPAEPIVRAVQHIVKRVTASTIPRHIYRRLSEGQVLLLLDGFDDLPLSERPAALAWLAAFMKEYGSNFVIAAGPATGFAGLVKVGFTPVYIRPWHQANIDNYITRFSGMWTAIGRRRGRNVKPVAADAVDRSRVGVRGLNPLELTLKLWAAYADDTEMPGYEGWLRAFLKRSLPDDRYLDSTFNSMALMGALQLEEGFITSSRLQALNIGDDMDAALPMPSIDASASAESSTDAAAPAAKRGRGRKKEEDTAETATVQGRLLGALRAARLLIRYRGDRYQFHPMLASYLASLTLKTPEQVTAKLDNPAWKQAVAYAAGRVPMDAIVTARLNGSTDLMQEQVIEMARWVPFAPVDAAWRGELLKHYGLMLTAPNQYPLLRERAAAALVETRDQRSALFILRKAVRNSVPEIRALACIGMGAMGDPEALKDLRALVRDQVEDVAVAATLALGAVGTPDAVEFLRDVFENGTERQRQAAAETFAMMPDLGYPILNAAMQDSDYMIRRSGAMGLRRLRTTWALIWIYRAYLDDDQWYVKSAAQQAYEELQFGRPTSPTAPYPTPDQIDWLKTWVSQKGEKLPQGDLASQMLIRALVEGDTETRKLAAINIGQLGMINAMKTLYNALRDRQDGVRISAHRALAILQMQLGRGLPAAN